MPRTRAPHVSRLRPGILIGSLLLSGALTGCFRVSFVDHGAKAQAKHGAKIEEHGYWRHKFAYGLINVGDEIDARDVCAAPPERVQTAGDVLTTGVSLLTLGIYTPRKVYFECQERTP